MISVLKVKACPSSRIKRQTVKIESACVSRISALRAELFINQGIWSVMEDFCSRGLPSGTDANGVSNIRSCQTLSPFKRFGHSKCCYRKFSSRSELIWCVLGRTLPALRVEQDKIQEGSSSHLGRRQQWCKQSGSQLCMRSDYNSSHK